MIELKIKKDERLLSDGQYLTNGTWLVNLDKIPLGDLLKEKIDIICPDRNQLSLIEDDTTINRDFSKFISQEWEYELKNEKIIHETDSGCKYQLFANINNGIVAWLDCDSLKLFKKNMPDDYLIYTQGQDKPVLFIDNQDEELFLLVLPYVDDTKMNELYALQVNYNANLINKKSAELILTSIEDNV